MSSADIGLYLFQLRGITPFAYKLGDKRHWFFQDVEIVLTLLPYFPCTFLWKCDVAYTNLLKLEFL